jgi:hypothetical protein
MYVSGLRGGRERGGGGELAHHGQTVEHDVEHNPEHHDNREDDLDDLDDDDDERASTASQ